MSPQQTAIIAIDPAPLHELSPHLYMQFMEPLGVTDGSVEAAWDHQTAAWRPDVIEMTQQLAPGMVRWGGCLSSYYRWRETVGPRDKRVPMHNLLWGGIESNQIGVAEFVDFCQKVGADALYCVNFESDGRKDWANPRVGGARSGNAQEAAEWVAYCNQLGHDLRREHGFEAPFEVRFWQLGNETSYDPNGFDLETAGRKTIEFARAMRAVDPEIRLIGWGDSGWAPRMLEMVGEHLDALAFHHMFHPSPDDAILDGTNYRRDMAATWDVLMGAHLIQDRKIKQIREETAGSEVPLALTECHFTLAGRDRGDCMATWATGAAYARMLHVHQRHGDRLKIATLSDFCGTRWQVNSLMIPTPGGKSYLLPVGQVMRLYRNHGGERAVAIRDFPADLDVVASRTGDRVFLHVVNTRRDRAVTTRIAIEGFEIARGRCFEIAADPGVEVLQNAPDAVKIEEKTLTRGALWTFPAASVSALELEMVGALT